MWTGARVLGMAVASVGAVVALALLTPSGSARPPVPQRPLPANASPETRVAHPSAVTITPLGHGQASANASPYVRPVTPPAAPVHVAPLPHR